jgi:hypothetical protein
MRLRVIKCVVLGVACLASPVSVAAQEAVLGGTVTDSTGAVLPGVTITAVQEATGNQFVAITDGRGVFRMPVRIGAYQLAAELQGFSTITRSGIQLLVGQTVTIALQMTPSALQEVVTVTAEAPLLNVTTSSLGGNIDSTQMVELPVQGRSWTQLALLAPGARSNNTSNAPVEDRGDVREYQLNMDGQQVTQNMGTGGQAAFSRDAIAEFQFLSNRFDASFGRSSGVQVNAITKSGTNRLSGTFVGEFRDSRFTTRNPVTGAEPTQQSFQNLSGTAGGPILRDRLHFFSNYEYERSPRLSVWNTPYPTFNVTLEGIQSKKIGGTRLDYQLSPSMRLMTKAHMAKQLSPFTGGASNSHPAGAEKVTEDSNEYLVQLTKVIGNRAVNEVRAGYSGFILRQLPLSSWSKHPQAHNGITQGHPRVTFTGFTIAGNQNAPRTRNQNMYMIRDDLAYSYDARGRHDLKAGGEYLFYRELTRNCRNCAGQFNAQGGTIASLGIPLETIFPDPFNADTWNMAAISPIVRFYNIGIADDFATPFDVPKTALWAQDDWQISSRLTVNLGVRYDLIQNGWANDSAIPPFLESGRPDDTNNIQPRLGFAYRLNERTVIRGGAGRYYGDILSNLQMWTMGNETIATIQILNDGRRDFAANPFNGPQPTTEEAFARFCDVNGGRPGCLVRAPNELAPPPEYAEVQNSWQTSIGFQRQVGRTIAFDVDYVWTGSRNEKSIQDNINLTYNPDTGVNYPFTDIARRPYPLFGTVSMTPYTGWSDYHALQTSLTKRFSDNWQLSATYTFAGLWDADPRPMSGLKEVTFDVAPDLGNEYTLAVSDQRHRAVVNGIWQVGYGFQISAIYLKSSGLRQNTSYGGDLRNIGGGGSARLRPDGTIVPRNWATSDPSNRVDVRLQERIQLPGRAAIAVYAEAFNVFREKNLSIQRQESSANFGLATTGQSRSMQFGFRLTY